MKIQLLNTWEVEIGVDSFRVAGHLKSRDDLFHEKVGIQYRKDRPRGTQQRDVSIAPIQPLSAAEAVAWQAASDGDCALLQVALVSPQVS